MCRLSRCRMPTAIECFEPGLRSTMVPTPRLRSSRSLRVDLLPSRDFGAVELGAPVEIDVRSVRISVSAGFFGEIEKSLLGTPEESLGVHSHLVRADGPFLLLDPPYTHLLVIRIAGIDFADRSRYGSPLLPKRAQPVCRSRTAPSASPPWCPSPCRARLWSKPDR